MIGNTFVNNPYGISGGDNLVAVNNLIVGSSVLALKQVDGNSIAAFNGFWNNLSDNLGSNLDAASSMFADPLLYSDERLAEGSPAIDAGTAFFEWMGQLIVDLGPEDFSGSAPDLGALEFAPRDPLVEPFVLADSDDAHENAAGTVVLSTPGLELGSSLGDQLVGLRFTGIDIPQGSRIHLTT